jgi:hypothetical protein
MLKIGLIADIKTTEKKQQIEDRFESIHTVKQHFCYIA